MSYAAVTATNSTISQRLRSFSTEANDERRLANDSDRWYGYRNRRSRIGETTAEDETD